MQDGLSYFIGASFGILVFIGMGGNLDHARTQRVTIIICKTATVLNSRMQCASPQSLGQEIDFRVNPASRAVQILPVKGAVRSAIYNSCSVLDTENWECPNGSGIVGMHNGRAYMDEPNGSATQSVSSVSGLNGWGLAHGLISLQRALNWDGAPY